jgi:hypothetical protein
MSNETAQSDQATSRPGINDVSEDALTEAAMILEQNASHIGWTDAELEQELQAVVRFLRLKAL